MQCLADSEQIYPALFTSPVLYQWAIN